MILHEYGSIYVTVTCVSVYVLPLTFASCMANARLVGHIDDFRDFKGE
jgi:hypothetical protein